MRGCAMATTRGEVEERGDGDAGEAAKSLGHAATRAPLHGPARLLGRRRVDLSGRGRRRVLGRSSVARITMGRLAAIVTREREAACG